MAETICVRCRGTVAPDGHCWDCGASQPSFRSHVELAAGAAAGVSDRGHRRAVNADAMALAVSGPWTIGVVCDGVSMSPRAERAAQVAADTALAVLTGRLAAGVLPETALDKAAVRAGAAVAALAASVHAAPACTYVAGITGPDGVWTSWVGDSRAYWLPDEGTAMALTEDDTGAHEALAAWLGADAGEPEPRGRSYRPSVPGRLLLCTDGLWRYLPGAASLRESLAGRAGEDPLDGARRLVRHALDAGGHDNVTAMLLAVR
ncbi:PP2C family protein-serine/threonine phosphatase [Actinomadura fibrosa]|uniref:PP2C family protein-serine/threonine phosphatase n=1 Tax=Actinomadura fibrosa TaxID=111802 RepID=A0ABW2Y020_9ACTN|nr:protein phosphatase 2C domain-containing protein [Actinomadura fibrosa]